MTKNIVWASLFILISGILQSSLLSHLRPLLKASPDIALCVLVFSAYLNGTMTGQLTGFFSGLLLDFLSASPLGLNLFVRTLMGAACGLLRGTFFCDLIFLPAALCAGATIFKALILFLLNFLFAGAVPAYAFTTPVLWVEVLLNAVCAPFVFALLKSFGTLLVTQKEG
ncbi:MAG: rod shape-determining protein MreD [Spirochaetaceae bacterium]|jgi:rod shape-determining protein MreD|nr:rod shape-determining protein MreD [Spirochaetaceae bacterium]